MKKATALRRPESHLTILTDRLQVTEAQPGAGTGWGQGQDWKRVVADQCESGPEEGAAAGTFDRLKLCLLEAFGQRTVECSIKVAK